MNKTLEQVIDETLRNCGRTASAVAAEMGKPLSTLSRETSQFDSGAKLGVTDLIPYSLATNSVAVVAYIADALGYRLESKNAAPDAEDDREEIIQAYEAVADFLKLAEYKAPFPELLKSRDKAIKEIMDVPERLKRERNAG